MPYCGTFPLMQPDIAPIRLAYPDAVRQHPDGRPDRLLVNLSLIPTSGALPRADVRRTLHALDGVKVARSNGGPEVWDVG